MVYPRVLIVDDEVSLQESLCEDLRLEGWHVEGANDGLQAIDKLRSHDFDLVVSDIHMPGMGGLELLQTVRKENDSIIFALMSGFTNIAIWDCFALGANEVFGKPFLYTDLQNLLARTHLPLSSKWGEPGKLQIRGKIRTHVELIRTQVDQCLSLGRSGMFLQLDMKPDVSRGDLISFHIVSPKISMDGIGRVRWKRSDGLGIEFLYLDESCRSRVIAAVEGGSVKAQIPAGAIRQAS